MKKIVIFDLDGTLALIDDRRKISTKPNGKLDWDKFFDPKNINLDKPNIPVIKMAQLLASTDHQIVIFSGRSDVTIQTTKLWLNKHKVPFDIIKMRPVKDFTPDDVLKQNWLNVIGKDNVLCTFDDRNKVVDMWRQNGIDCFQVADGNF
tara:strand:- start:106 stop:552 length:447 start_codon:yes stop_codon:yes gene_type:complete